MYKAQQSKKSRCAEKVTIRRWERRTLRGSWV